MGKQVISRNKSECIVKDSEGRLWLTRRKKHKKDISGRRLRKRTIIHIPIKRIMQQGDWLFTCSMAPKQFSHWINDDMFETLDGSQHSVKNCSMKPISEQYAIFFTSKGLDKLFDIHNDFESYELAVKQVCNAFKVVYEGI